MRFQIACGLLVLSLIAFGQSRVDDFPVTSVRVNRIVLWPLLDGGCVSQWCGEAVSSDGGVSLSVCTADVDLKATVNRNRCDGLATAGLNRLAREMRFDVDAGAP